MEDLFGRMLGPTGERAEQDLRLTKDIAYGETVYVRAIRRKPAGKRTEEIL